MENEAYDLGDAVMLGRKSRQHIVGGRGVVSVR